VWLNLRDGTKVRGPAVADSDDDLVELIATAARRLGRSERRWDHAQPELNLQLPNGDRLHALMAVSGRPTVTIRRHDFDIHRVDQLVDAVCATTCSPGSCRPRCGPGRT
jgi:pilus assembly protein CpaF